jgi:hypothetical protein
MKNTMSFRQSENLVAECLGRSVNIKDPQFDAVMQCQDEVRELRQAATASTMSLDSGVSAIKDGVLHNLEIGEIGAVEKFLKHPAGENIPSRDTLRGPAYALVEKILGYDTSLNHRRELVKKATDFLKSPAGDDLVLKLDGQQPGPD